MRKFLGPIKKEDDSWTLRTKLEIENLVTEPNILEEIKSSSPPLAQHVERIVGPKREEGIFGMNLR